MSAAPAFTAIANAQRFDQLFPRGAGLDRSVGVYGDASVTLTCHGYAECDELPRLGVELAGLLPLAEGSIASDDLQISGRYLADRGRELLQIVGWLSCSC